MAKKLFIGSFSLSTTEVTLRELFSQCGEILTLTIITDHETRQSRGFGFVEMATEEAAREAIAKLNGSTLDDRNIVVKEALEKTSYKGMNDYRGFSNRRPRRY